MADSFLVLVPHKTLHGTISILIQRPKLATNVGKMGAVKNKMPFIPQCPGPAQSAAAEMRGDGRFSKPTLFHRQGMRPHAELHQQPYPGNGHWKLKVMDEAASVCHQHDILSRQAMMYLLTIGWFLAHTSLAMTPVHSATNGEYSSLRSARAGHSKSMCLSSPKAPV